MPTKKREVESTEEKTQKSKKTAGKQPDVNNIFEALALWQDNIEEPQKDIYNEIFDASYVSLDSILKSIKNAKKKLGITIYWHQEVRIIGQLADGHSEGQVFTVFDGYGAHLEIPGSQVVVPAKTKRTNDAQTNGIALTYARRYSLSMAFEIITDQDTDGAVPDNKSDNSQGRASNNSKPVKKSESTPDLAQIVLSIANNYVLKTKMSAPQFFKLVKDITGKDVLKFDDIGLFEKDDLMKLNEVFSEALTNA